MTTQASLFDLMAQPAIRRAIEPDGPVVQGDSDETLACRDKSSNVAIELHRDRESGLWMWSVCFQLPGCGGGYKVGAKWGNFARDRASALHHAKSEARQRLETVTDQWWRAESHSAARKLIARIEGLT